jgi:hypothetical protein
MNTHFFFLNELTVLFLLDSVPRNFKKNTYSFRSKIVVVLTTTNLERREELLFLVVL